MESWDGAIDVYPPGGRVVLESHHFTVDATCWQHVGSKYVIKDRNHERQNLGSVSALRDSVMYIRYCPISVRQVRVTRYYKWWIYTWPKRDSLECYDVTDKKGDCGLESSCQITHRSTTTHFSYQRHECLEMFSPKLKTGWS